jgi:hypothetical protein
MADPVTAVLVPGFLGGLLVAALIVGLRAHSQHDDQVVMPYRPLPISTDMINMASIKVAGAGGLGLVAMAGAVALGVPRIFETTALGLVLGTGLAIVLILRRSRA